MKSKKRRGISPLILFLMITFLAIFVFSMLAHVLFPIDLGETHLLARLKAPQFIDGSSGYLLGTDSLGRDFAVRLVYATQNSLLISTAGMIIAMAIGLALGVLSGLYGGWLDHAIMFLVDARMSIPFIIIAIVCASVFGSDKITMALIMGLTGWSTFTRLIRGQILQLKKADFIECSRSIGASRLRILFEHILINISSPLIVDATMRLSSFILLESSLSFLGLGIQPPDVSLGVLVSSGRDYLINNWWLAIAPSTVIVGIVLQVSLIGDWLRDRLDPKLQNNA